VYSIKRKLLQAQLTKLDKSKGVPLDNLPPKLFPLSDLSFFWRKFDVSISLSTHQQLPLYARKLFENKQTNFFWYETNETTTMSFSLLSYFLLSFLFFSSLHSCSFLSVKREDCGESEKQRIF